MKYDSFNKKNKKGFSLIELIVTMGVMAVLVGVAAYSAVYINNANVSKAANKLESVIIEARTISMAKGPEAGCLTLFYDGVTGTFEYKIGLFNSTESGVICNSQIDVYARSDTTMAAALNTTHGFTDITTGTFIEQLVFNSAGGLTYGYPRSYHEAIWGNAACSYMLQRGDRKIVIDIFPNTGTVNHYMSYN